MTWPPPPESGYPEWPPKDSMAAQLNRLREQVTGLLAVLLCEPVFWFWLAAMAWVAFWPWWPFSLME